MAIKKSVGKLGANHILDAKVIQASLNSISIPYGLPQKLIVDGLVGKKTIEAIELFQNNVVRLVSPDGCVNPNKKTHAVIKKYLSKKITLDVLLAIMGHGERQKIEVFYPQIEALLPRYKVNTPLRKSHFLAQIGHESLSLIYTEEIATGQAYEGRVDLGNTQKGDGVRFKGRGLIQLTGRHNYTEYGIYIGIELLADGQEKLISISPKYALDVALWFWNKRKLNNYADRDDLLAITRRVNGGYNGLEDRQDYLNRAKFFLL